MIDDTPRVPGADEELSAHGQRRRTALSCMAWAGAGVVWTLSGGIPGSRLIGGAEAATADSRAFSFVQISDSHIGFARTRTRSRRARSQAPSPGSTPCRSGPRS